MIFNQVLFLAFISIWLSVCFTLNEIRVNYIIKLTLKL